MQVSVVSSVAVGPVVEGALLNLICPLLAKSEPSGPAVGMSALPPKADISEGCEKCLLMTQSGHSFDCAFQVVCEGTQRLPYLCSFLASDRYPVPRPLPSSHS